MNVPHSLIDQFHSALLGDDTFTEALQNVAWQVAQEHCDSQPCETDEEDVYELAMELVMKVAVA